MKVKANIVIIGAGYYGCYAAYKLAAEYPDLKVALLEKESEICTRASSTNQGQLHRGYMYTAKPKLAFECSEFAKVFEEEFPTAINKKVRSYFGIHKNSLISSQEFEDTCKKAKLPLVKTDKNEFFGKDITKAYRTTESTINTSEMRKQLAIRLFKDNIDIYKSLSVDSVSRTKGKLIVETSENITFEADIVINASFASINKLHAESGITTIPTKNDTFLHFMVSLPERYKHIAATVAVGDYCSLMPSNFRGSHLLAVGGTRNIASSLDIAPTEVATRLMAKQLYKSSIDRCSEWVPFLSKGSICGYTVGTRTEYRDPETGKSMSEVKVIRDHDGLDNYTVLLGGKISCVSECMEPLRDSVNRAISRSMALSY